jgi:hypothetical protein
MFSRAVYIPVTPRASPGTRTRAAGVKTGAFFPDAALRIGPFFGLSADSTQFQKDRLTSRTGKERSSWE